MKTFGRKTIYVNYTEKELLNANLEEQKKIILDIIKNSMPLHLINRRESKYLQDYLYGLQDIQFKEKKTRTDINNKNVENWAYAFCDWKKTFLLGKPIKYAPINDVATEEIEELNKYMTYENKEWLDQELYEDIFTVGRGYRYTFGDKIDEVDDAPFELLNLDVLNTEVVYSSSINHEQILTFVHQDKTFIVTDDTGKEEERYYDEIDVYTRNKHFVVNNKITSNYQVIKAEPITINTHCVTEYYMNRKRMSLLEIAKDLFNDINKVENLDLDDIEQFVNSIMVFTNASVNKESMDAIKEYGAVSISSTEQKRASVEILQSRLKSLDTQIYYLRKLAALHAILSVPQASSNGEVSNAETGKAILTGQGFTSASIRVEGEEQAFKKFDRTSLKTILKICKAIPTSKIQNLNITEIESKFNRDLSDNLLVKSQALQTLASAMIPPEVRNQVVGLFNDPIAVTRLQEKYEKEKREIESQLKQNNSTQEIRKQNNVTQDTLETQNQNQ